MREISLKEHSHSFGERALTVRGKTWDDTSVVLTVPYAHITDLTMGANGMETVVGIEVGRLRIDLQPTWSAWNGNTCHQTNATELRDFAAELSRRMGA